MSLILDLPSDPVRRDEAIALIAEYAPVRSAKDEACLCPLCIDVWLNLMEGRS